MGAEVEDTDDQQIEEVDEQSDVDQADDDDTGVEGDDAAEEENTDGDDDAESEDDADEGGEDDKPLLSQKRIDELKNDPDKLHKELNAAATKKFQRLAETRKKLEPYADFINSYENNPREAARQLAERLGLEFVKPKSQAASEAAVVKLSDQIHAKVKAALGEEYADLADRLSGAITDAATLITDEAVKPLKEGQDTLISESAMRESKAALDAFTEKNPNWKKHEKAMVALTKKYPVGEGVSEAEYLDSIFYLATRNGREGDAVKKVSKKMADSAKKSGVNGRTVSDNTVSKSPTGRLPSWEESVAAARRGETLD